MHRVLQEALASTPVAGSVRPPSAPSGPVTGGPRWACFPCLVTSSGGAGWSAARASWGLGSSLFLLLRVMLETQSADTGEDAGKEKMEVPEAQGKAGLYCRS